MSFSLSRSALEKHFEEFCSTLLRFTLSCSVIQLQTPLHTSEWCLRLKSPLFCKQLLNHRPIQGLGFQPKLQVSPKHAEESSSRWKLNPSCQGQATGKASVLVEISFHSDILENRQNVAYVYPLYGATCFRKRCWENWSASLQSQ